MTYTPLISSNFCDSASDRPPHVNVQGALGHRLFAIIHMVHIWTGGCENIWMHQHLVNSQHFCATVIQSSELVSSHRSIAAKFRYSGRSNFVRKV